MRILFTLLALLSFHLGFSTHLLGGYITYTHVTGTTYQVKLTLYRDCFSPTPFDGTAGSTTPAIIGIFESNTNNLITTLSLTNPTITTQIGDSTLPCTVPPNVCREIGVYTTTVTLPSAATSYTLVHERCCLPGNVTNVYTPGDQGSVFMATIPANADNNSPSINLTLSRYISIYDTTSIANWCTDADGDSLVYSLTNPLSGASVTNPAPNPPIGAPYPPVTLYPGYTATQPFGQASTCSINSQFGQIRIIPQGAGIFMVNITVSEYRNSLLLSEYPVLLNINVGDCNNPNPPINPDTIATGISNISAAEGQLSIYPNPASSYVTVEDATATNGTNVAIVNVNGSLALTGTMLNGKYSFENIAALPKGVYLVKVGNGIGKRFIKQ